MFSVNHTSSSIRLPGITELDRFLCSQSPTQGKTSGIFSSSLAIFTDSVDASDPSRYTAKVPAFPPATYPGHIIRVDSNYTSAWSDALRRPRLSVEKPNPMYSIDVLRLDPSKSSLDWHLSSRMAFEHNTSGSEDAPCTTFAGERSTTQSQISQPTAQLPRSLWAYRFPISPYSARLSVIVDDANYARKHSGNLYRTSEEEYSRRRHICPFCRMRFKRPSGLRTHLNTHTGATPFRCPYPNCGRHFNVKSNMLRHHRAHTPSISSSTVMERTQVRPRSSLTGINFEEPALSDLSAAEGIAPSSHPRLRQVFSWSATTRNISET